MQRHGPHDPIPPQAKGVSLAIGNFDGVHLGHQALIAAAREAGAQRSAPAGVALFDPHPRNFFQPDAPPFRLQTPAQRSRALAKLGAAHEFVLGFDRTLMNLTARAFAEQILVARLSVRHVSVGGNFRYGRGRGGDAASLAQDGAALGFGVTAVDPVMDAQGARISSTAIRDALERGDVDAARVMLGRPWAIEGVVTRGFARGRDFGFPTLNIPLGAYLAPKLGVYAVRADLGGVLKPGVASIGVNPTFGALPAPLLEAHLFDFDGDLYGRHVEVEIVAFLRPEIKFDSIEALKAQMARDAAQARMLLG
jgi:riboflavin kinase/FMN adenylyltransferase